MGGKSTEGGVRVLGFSPGSVPLCCVILCKSLALSVLFPSCTSKGSDWVAFSALIFFHSLREAGEDSSMGTRKPPAFETLSDRQGCQAGGSRRADFYNLHMRLGCLALCPCL